MRILAVKLPGGYRIRRWSTPAKKIARLTAFSERKAKDAARVFVPDTERKQKAVKPWMRAISERWITPHYEALERRRRGGE